MRSKSRQTEARVRSERRGAARAARRRTFVSIAISGAVHAALLAWVVVDVPASDTPIDRAAIRAPAPVRAAVDRPIQVVQIRPPGVALPSGGASTRTAEAPPSIPAEPVATAPKLSAAATAPGAMLASLTPVESSSSWSLPAPAGEPEETAEATGRPNRGVILRGRAGGGQVASGGRGTGSSTGGLGSGVGVTIVGPGGDCITPGLAVPGAGLGSPVVRPEPRVRPGGLVPGGLKRAGRKPLRDR